MRNEETGRRKLEHGSLSSDLRHLASGFCVLHFAFFIFLAAPTRTPAQTAPAPEDAARKLGLDAADLKKTQRGEFVRKGLKEGSDQELAGVAAGFFPQTVSQLADGELTGQFLDTNDPTSQYHIWNPDASAGGEFSGVALAAKDAKEAKIFSRAKPGDKLNLSVPEIEQFKKAGADPAAINAALSALLQARFEAYRQSGLSGIAPYARGENDSLSAGQELRLAINETIPLVSQPELLQALLTFPTNRTPGAEHRFYWSKQMAEDRPMFILEHRAELKWDDTAAVVTEEQFYVGHTYNANFIAVEYLAVPGGTYVFFVNRTFTDQVAGFGSGLRHAIGRKQMLTEVAGNLQFIRDKLKQTQTPPAPPPK